MHIFTSYYWAVNAVKTLARSFLWACLLIFLPKIVFAQNQPVSGSISDEKGGTMQGVSVNVKGTAKGTLTDASGHYIINVPDGGVLVFSYLGYTKQEANTDGKSHLDIVLQPEATNLTEVVVVGYGSVKKKDLTGSVGIVNMDDLDKAPVKSFDDALAGRVAGVQVVSNDGQPGGNATITIRGIGSITQDATPLFVVDGFAMEASTFNMNSISPADIESITVLKDASSTAIYGARGSNGVILITTKHGKAGAPEVSYNTYYGIQKIPKKEQLMDPYNFVKYVTTLNPTVADTVYLTNGTTLNDYKNAPDLDFQNYIFRTGTNQNQDLSIRGGGDQTRYSISGNYNDQNGIIILSGFKRYQGRFTLDQTVTNRIKVGINVNYAYSLANGQPIASPQFYASATPLFSVYGYRPTAGLGSTVNLTQQPYDPLLINNPNADYSVNPLSNMENQQYLNKTTNFVANAYADYAITDHLNFRATGAITNNSTVVSVFNNVVQIPGGALASSGVNGSIMSSPVTSLLSEDMLTYTGNINTDHHFSILADYSVQTVKSSVYGFSATQIPIADQSLGLQALDLSSTYTSTTTSTQNALVSYLGRVNYDYKSKYLLTATLRADGSSKFEQRWGYFPSAAAAWRISSEDFMQQIPFISDAKLRLSYGASGNNRVSDFAYLPQLALSNINYWYSSNNAANAPGAVYSSAGNYNLKWETTVETDLGLDLSLFENRVGLTVDAYNRVTHNLLLNASLPYYMGIGSAGGTPLSASGYENVGELGNKGLEITINTVNINTQKFGWNSNFNISWNSNKILALANNQNALFSNFNFNTSYSSLFPYIAEVGHPIGQMYGLIFNGVYQYSDFNKLPNGNYVLKPNIPDNGLPRASVQPGDVKYKDLNGDLTINNQDYTTIGNGLPKYVGGFSNNFRYGNFDLNVFLQWSVGNDIINGNNIIFQGSTGLANNPFMNQFASYDDYWTPTNPSNTLPKPGGAQNAAFSSRFVENGSYLKLRTVSFGYNFSPGFLRRINIKRLRASVSAQNILTITGYSGLDPEVSSRNSNLTPGFDYTAYPHSLSVVFGLGANF